MVRGVLPVGCGQCMPCRIAARRVLVTQLMLEARTAPGAFVTLTYDDEHLPAEGLRKRDVQLFLKRLRKAVAPLRIRYLAVGEYGERTGRAHYHLCLFGVEDLLWLDSIMRGLWPFGFVSVGSLTIASANYCAGYVTKKMTSRSDTRLDGRMPEFSLRSTRPGLGARAFSQIARSPSLTSSVVRLSEASSEPLTRVRIHGRRLPLGRYLTRVLREAAGLDANKAADLYAAKMQDLREVSGVDAATWRQMKPFIDWDAIEVREMRHGRRKKGSL